PGGPGSRRTPCAGSTRPSASIPAICQRTRPLPPITNGLARWSWPCSTARSLNRLGRRAGEPPASLRGRLSMLPRVRVAFGRLFRRPLLLLAVLLGLGGAGAVAGPHVWAWYHFRAGRTALE